MIDYRVGQEVTIATTYAVARASGYINGPRKYETTTVVSFDERFAYLATGERIDRSDGSLLPTTKDHP